MALYLIGAFLLGALIAWLFTGPVILSVKPEKHEDPYWDLWLGELRGKARMRRDMDGLVRDLMDQRSLARSLYLITQVWAQPSTLLLTTGNEVIGKNNFEGIEATGSTSRPDPAEQA